MLFRSGDWRIEISPKDARNFDTFLNVLSPRSVGSGDAALAELLRNDQLATIMRLGDDVVGFGTTGRIDGPFSYYVDGGTHRHLLVDLAPGELYRISNGVATWEQFASDQGVLTFSETAAGAHLVSVVVPEPASLLMLLLGGPAAIALARKK